MRISSPPPSSTRGENSTPSRSGGFGLRASQSQKNAAERRTAAEKIRSMRNPHSRRHAPPRAGRGMDSFHNNGPARSMGADASVVHGFRLHGGQGVHAPVHRTHGVGEGGRFRAQ